MKTIITIAFLLFTVNSFGQTRTYRLEDLTEFSKNHYGFLKTDKTINEYYGDFDCIDKEKSIFNFNVGCGRGGDIISILIKENSSRLNCFDLYLQKGDIYYGNQAYTNKKIGEFLIICEDEIRGNIKLCLEKGAACCGEEGEIFTLMKLK
ncbi:MAG TPA: hypothetical protein PKH58_00245 [Paludibacteraceae bacterium]|nr:hypothetical protein [Paludibacteraceae bacterium]